MPRKPTQIGIFEWHSEILITSTYYYLSVNSFRKNFNHITVLRFLERGGGDYSQWNAKHICNLSMLFDDDDDVIDSINKYLSCSSHHSMSYHYSGGIRFPSRCDINSKSIYGIKRKNKITF